MGERRGWERGVPAAAALGLVAVWLVADRIADDLAARTAAAVAAVGEPWAEVAVIGRDVVIGGRAPDAAAAERARAAAGRVGGVRRVVLDLTE